MKSRNIIWLAITIISILAIILLSACSKGTPTPTQTTAPASTPPTPTATRTPTPSDTIAPQITYVFPGAANIGVNINVAIVAFFSERMNPATITNSTFTLTQGTTPVAGTVNYTSAISAIFTPAALLTANTTYTATVTTGVKDLAGNAMLRNLPWNFTTGSAPDIQLPIVSSTVPAISASGVAVNDAITATFSEVMNP